MEEVCQGPQEVVYFLFRIYYTKLLKPLRPCPLGLLLVSLKAQLCIVLAARSHRVRWRRRRGHGAKSG